MELTVVGCGDAFGSGGLHHTCFHIKDEQTTLLLDCGASSLNRLQKLGLDVDAIDYVIISHFHGDHYGGIPFLIINKRYNLNSYRPMTIVGPKGLQSMVYGLQKMMYPGTESLLEELNIQFIEYGQEWVDLTDFSILARPVIHSPGSNPHAYKLKFEEKIIGFSGDTEWTDELFTIAEGTDLFICESNNFINDSPGHLSYKTIKENTARFGSKRIVLSHFGPEMLAQSDLPLEQLQEGRTVFF